MSKKKQRKPHKTRNWHAVAARSRTSAGPMGDEKKEKSRRLCREEIDEEEFDGSSIDRGDSHGLEEPPDA